MWELKEKDPLQMIQSLKGNIADVHRSVTKAHFPPRAAIMVLKLRCMRAGPVMSPVLCRKHLRASH